MIKLIAPANLFSALVFAKYLEGETESMNKHIKVVFIIIFVFLSNTSKAQIYEVGTFTGISAYRGDLNTEKVFNKIWVAGGGMIRYNHGQHVSLRLNASVTELRGSDLRGSQPYIIIPPGKQYEFETILYELSLQGEINFLPFITGDTDTRFTPYLFGGLGGIYFNPRAYRNANSQNPVLITDDIHWGTAGEPDDFSNFSIISLFGYGFKFNLSENFMAGIEWGMRYAGLPFTRSYGSDYLDMVSLRGNPKNNDWYSMLGLTFTYKFLDRSQPPCPNHNL